MVFHDLLEFMALEPLVSTYIQISSRNWGVWALMYLARYLFRFIEEALVPPLIQMPYSRPEIVG